MEHWSIAALLVDLVFRKNGSVGKFVGVRWVRLRPELARPAAVVEGPSRGS